MALAMVVSPRFRFPFASFFARFLLRSSFFDDDVDSSLVEFDSAASSIDLARDFDDVSIDSSLDLLSYLMTISICTLFLLSFTYWTTIL